MERAFSQFSSAEDLPEVLSTFQTLEEECRKQDGSSDSTSAVPCMKLVSQLARCTLTAGADMNKAYLSKLRNTPEHLKCTEEIKVVIVGGGPGGLRCAIEARVLGAHVEVVEKRNTFSRFNILKVWPGVVEDGHCISLKSFYPRFGGEESTIWRVQSAMLKIALLLGVKVHIGGFESILPPPKAPKHPKQSPSSPSPSSSRWQAMIRDGADESSKGLTPIECDVLVGADGENSGVAMAANIASTEVQFSKALGITFNFLNTNTPQEIQPKTFAHTGYMYREWFGEIKDLTGVELENLVYFREGADARRQHEKDDPRQGTHYFVMAARPESLLTSGILLHSNDALPDDVPYYLHPKNIDHEKLHDFTRKLAVFVGLPDTLELAKHINGREDISVFDFTKKRACQFSSRVLAVNDKRLLVSLLGDALAAPFWPLGTGMSKSVLGAFDVTYAISKFAKLTSNNASDEQFAEMLMQQFRIFSLMKFCSPLSLAPNVRRGPQASKGSRYHWTIDPESRYKGFKSSKGEREGDGHVTEIGPDAGLTLTRNKTALGLDLSGIKAISCYRDFALIKHKQKFTGGTLERKKSSTKRRSRSKSGTKSEKTPVRRKSSTSRGTKKSVVKKGRVEAVDVGVVEVVEEEEDDDAAASRRTSTATTATTGSRRPSAKAIAGRVARKVSTASASTRNLLLRRPSLLHLFGTKPSTPKDELTAAATAAMEAKEQEVLKEDTEEEKATPSKSEAAVVSTGLVTSNPMSSKKATVDSAAVAKKTPVVIEGVASEPVIVAGTSWPPKREEKDEPRPYMRRETFDEHHGTHGDLMEMMGSMDPMNLPLSLQSSMSVMGFVSTKDVEKNRRKSSSERKGSKTVA